MPMGFLRRIFGWFRVIILTGFLFLIPCFSRAENDELRAYWADAFATGFHTAAQIDKMLADMRSANCNAVVVEVRKRGDAYYNSNFEPKATDVSPQSFDPLAYMIAQGHDTNGGKQRIEIHCWLVTYHIWNPSTAGGVPPQPTHPYNLHPDWLMKDINGQTYIGGQYTFDQGHPGVQQHTFNVALDIVTNYDVDGINFDYIRFNNTTEGYNDVSVARFNKMFGRTGAPATDDPVWKQFRRDQITGLLRKVYLQTMAVRPSVKVSVDAITWNPSPANLSQWYSSSAAWNTVLQDWRGWLEEGIMDLVIPMNYYRQGVHPQDYLNWMNFAKDYHYDRHAMIGPGVYLNFATNAILQMRLTRNASPNGNYAQGVCGYSYAVPSTNNLVTQSNFFKALVQPSAYDTNPVPIFSQRANPPIMPWKSAPTKGHLKGFIYGGNATNPLDGATAMINGIVRTNDPTGFYGFVDLVPGNYNVTISFPGYGTVISNITIAAGNVATRDFILSSTGPPAIATQPQSQTVYVGASTAFAVSASGPGTLNYQWRREGANMVTATASDFSFNNVATNQAGNYDVIVANAFGAVTSQVATLTVLVPPTNARLIPLWNLPPGSKAYLTSGSTMERGISYNPQNNHLILVGRSGSTQVYVLDSTNGNLLHTLALGSGVISGGTYTLLMTGVADDGAVYIGNLALADSPASFKLYRWANDNSNTVPTLAFSGNPSSTDSQRWGDTMDVRGSGTNTQVLIGSRAGTNVVIFTTSNGINFTPNVINVSGVSGGAFGLGIAFGEGNTFWGKANGSVPLRQIAFDFPTGSGSVLRTHGSPGIPSSITAIGVSTLLNLIAGIALETPDHLKLYDLTTNNSTPILIETNSFPTDNANDNGTGSVDFGGDRVFALDSNNGLIAMRVVPLPVRFDVITMMVDQRKRLQLSGGRGIFQIEGTSDFVNWTPVISVTNTNGIFEATDPETNVPARFYRATVNP
jgi:uncharacterized lipoprotein YddW (UPF0748 family)